MLAYILHPLALMRSAPQPRGVRLTPIDDVAAAPIPEALRDYARRSEAALIHRGFAPPVYATSAFTASVDTCVALYEHPRDGALGVAMISVPKARPFTASSYFVTRFADGMKLLTSNSPTLLRTPPLPDVDAVRFLGVTDLALLYTIHQARVAERARAVKMMPESRGADPIAYQDREARTSQDFWVKQGYHRYVDDDRMKLTTKGAIFAAWRGLFPWKQLTELRIDRKMRTVSRRLGIALRPK